MSPAKNILITGGSGMIGSRLTTLLIEAGHRVSHLSRSPGQSSVKTFAWHPERSFIDEKAFEDIDTIVHLAGAGIADKRWSARRKTEILLSRTDSSRLLAEAIRRVANHVSALISASGISYYGLKDPGRPFDESEPPAQDFMAKVTVAWEKEIDAVKDRVRVVKIRTGVVLSQDGVAMKKLTMPVKFFVGAPLGSGKQFVNWIHIDDVCRMYVKAVEDPNMQGVYNGVAPNPVTNAELTRELARVLNRPLWLPPVPRFIVKLIAGEVADVVLEGGRISSSKIEQSGFHFQFGTIRTALQDLLAVR
jgi:uncharacterized protein